MPSTKLDEGWDVEVLGGSERSSIDTLKLHDGRRFYRVRFDRAKGIFIDAPPPKFSQGALNSLPSALDALRARRRAGATT